MSFSFANDADGLPISILDEEEDLDIKVERLSDSSSEIDESLLEDLLVKKIPRRRNPPPPPSDTDGDFCILCLRKFPPGSKVTFCPNSEAIDVAEAQRKVNQAVGLSVKLQYRAMCRTCWQLVELITDFRQCSEKATRKLKLLLTGMDYDQRNDEWMAESTLNAIELKRQMVWDHMERLDVEETKMRKAARQNRAKQKKEQANAKIIVETIPAIEQDDAPSHDAQEEPECEPSDGDHPQVISNPTASNATDPVPLEESDYQASIFTCEICDRNFDGHHSIRVHKTHCKPGAPAKEKYFSCSICTATFIENSGLTFHMNKHKGIRPFKCRKFCDHTFFSNFARIKHERRYCEQEGRICDVCGQLLKNEGSLKMHKANVHGEAKHICDICGKKFRSLKSHRLHKRVHSEERNYVCTVCNKGFKAPFSLKVHKRTHTQDMPYSCNLCERAFNYRVSLKNHIERHHQPYNVY